jgi:hypothetical protein
VDSIQFATWQASHFPALPKQKKKNTEEKNHWSHFHLSIDVKYIYPLRIDESTIKKERINLLPLFFADLQ